MTHDVSQILVHGDKALETWMLDRFGVDVNKTFVSDRMLIEIQYRGPMRLHVSFLLGADDLAAFPLLEKERSDDVDG